MLRSWAVAVLVVAAAPALAQTRPLQGGVQQNQGQPAPDVFSSGGQDDRRAYVKDGWFDRCAYERDHPGFDTRTYGQPDIVPIDRISSNEARAKYVRCAANACGPPGTAVCWRNPPTPPGNGTNFYPDFPSPSGRTPPRSPDTARAPTTPAPPPSAACVPVAEPLRAELRQLARDLTDATHSALGTGNRIFFGWLIGTAMSAKGLAGDLPQAWSDFLAQPPGVPRQQIVDFLSHPNENFETGLRLAEAAGDKLYQDYLNDPGTTTGMLLSNFNPMPACTALRDAGEAAAAARAVQKVSAVRRAAEELKALAKPSGVPRRARVETAGTPRPGGPGSPFVPPLNPSMNSYNCIECVMAQAREWMTGKTAPAPNGWRSVTGRLVTDRGIDDRELFFKLGVAYGRNRIAGLEGTRSTWQALGKPYPMKIDEAYREILASKDGMGLLFFYRQEGPGVFKGHVVALRRIGGRVEATDPQWNIPGINPTDDVLRRIVDVVPDRSSLYRVR